MKNIIPLILISVFISSISFAEIYRCVDSQGKVRHTTSPGPGCTLLQESIPRPSHDTDTYNRRVTGRSGEQIRETSGKVIHERKATAQNNRSARTGNWRNSWSSEKRAAAQRCAKTFEDYQVQAICMNNERKGYEKMQGNFGLPSSIAQQAKVRCARIFEDFQVQAICMQNEKKGYDKMQSY